MHDAFISIQIYNISECKFGELRYMHESTIYPYNLRK